MTWAFRWTINSDIIYSGRQQFQLHVNVKPQNESQQFYRQYSFQNATNSILQKCTKIEIQSHKVTKKFLLKGHFLSTKCWLSSFFRFQMNRHTLVSHFTVSNVIYICLQDKFTFKALNGLSMDLYMGRIHQFVNHSKQEFFRMQEKLNSTEAWIFFKYWSQRVGFIIIRTYMWKLW